MGESSPTDRNCVECGDAMRPVRLVSRGDFDIHKELEYAAADAERRFLTSRYPAEGKVAAWLCDGCGRIALYADPSSQEM